MDYITIALFVVVFCMGYWLCEIKKEYDKRQEWTRKS